MTNFPPPQASQRFPVHPEPDAGHEIATPTRPPHSDTASVIDLAEKPVSRKRQWTIGLITYGLAILLAVTWGVWVTLRVGEYPPKYPAGQSWTDPKTGSTFTPLSLEKVDSYMSYGTDPVKAPPGGTFAFFQLKAEKINKESNCSFILYGKNGQSWRSSSKEQDDKPGTCSDMRESGSGTLYLIYEIPEKSFSELRGIAQDGPMQLKQPPLLMP